MLNLPKSHPTDPTQDSHRSDTTQEDDFHLQPNNTLTGAPKTALIGDYHDPDAYDLLNNDNWYCKYGYVPSTLYYLNKYGGADKELMEFGCADGEYTLQYF